MLNYGDLTAVFQNGGGQPFWVLENDFLNCEYSLEVSKTERSPLNPPWRTARLAAQIGM